MMQVPLSPDIYDIGVGLLTCLNALPLQEQVCSLGVLVNQVEVVARGAFAQHRLLCNCVLN